MQDWGELHRMNVPVNDLQLPLKAVIYATDFSPCSQNAGKYASLVARQFNADLLAAHAFVLSQAAMEVEAEDGAVKESGQRKDLETALSAIAKQLGEGLRRAVPVLVEGDPRECIPRLAEQNAPSLIVLGTHGGGRLGRGIIGSLAERILRTTNGPSLTVGPAVPVCGPACAPFRRILFATGLSAAAARGAPYAVGMAQAFDASLDVLHVAHEEEVENPDRFSEIQRQFYVVLEGLVGRQGVAIREPRGIVEAGSAHQHIMKYIREFGVDLLVLSIRKSSHLWLQSRISGAFHIIANAPCPVLTITG